MILIDDIVKQFGGIPLFSNRKTRRLEKAGITLLLEYLGNGPIGGPAMSLIALMNGEELEMHFEKRVLCWLPYYLRDSRAEVFLYKFVGARQPLKMDQDAGSCLIQRACFLELILRSHGFDRLDHESLYHPLFARSAS